MIQIKTFSDERHDMLCAYCCRDLPTTRDHVPSKILLDKPFPENLPVVPCCLLCNQNFSLDEEYFACLIECALSGTTNPASIKRKSIRKILSKKESLRQKLAAAQTEIAGRIFFKTEINRVKNVVLKLAKGHAKFENTENLLDEPKYLTFKPLLLMSEVEKNFFFSINKPAILPEIGSRMSQRVLIEANSIQPYWIIIQPDNYQYTTSIDNDVSVKIVIRNYLAIEVKWS